MSDTIQVKNIQQLYSESAKAKPSADLVEVGQLWINLSDNTIGSKKSDGQIVTYGQLTEEERDQLLSGGGAYIPKQGVVSGITVSTQGLDTDGDVVINDDSEVTLLKTMAASTPLTVSIAKTTGHKVTKLVITKPENVTGTISWSGVDSWLSTFEAPIFGESADPQELCLAVFTSPTHVAVNVIYNTENPNELDISGATWGQISGTLADQADLNGALGAKANTADVVSKTGNRGALAGYETISTTAEALSVSQESPDSQQVTAAVQITVVDGSSGTSWVKKVSITNASASISLGSKWHWVGGTTPVLTTPCLLVLSWDNDYGMAILNTIG